MYINFYSTSPCGYNLSCVNLGVHQWNIINENEVVCPFDKMFVYISDKTQDDAFISLKKPAAFTIQAVEREKGITRKQIVDQVKNIMDCIINNQDVFAMTNSDVSTINSLFVRSLNLTSQGHWQLGIENNVINFTLWNDEKETTKQKSLYITCPYLKRETLKKYSYYPLDYGYDD